MNPFVHLSIIFFQCTDTELRLEHWKTLNSAPFSSRAGNSISKWLKGPTRSRDFFINFSLVYEAISPTFDKWCNTLIWTDFSHSIFFEICIENFLFIENEDFRVFFKPYLLPHFTEWKAAIFTFSSSFVPLTITETFLRCAIEFLRYFKF